MRMKEINKKIRNGIINSHHLRSLAKDGKITQKEKDRLYEKSQDLDKRIIFYKHLRSALINQKKEDSNNNDFNR